MSLITATQQRGLDMQCKRLGVDAAAFLRHCWAHLEPGRPEHADLRQVPYEIAQKSLQQINRWQQDPSQIKDGWRGYDADWLQGTQQEKEQVDE